MYFWLASTVIFCFAFLCSIGCLVKQERYEEMKLASITQVKMSYCILAMDPREINSGSIILM